MKELVPCWYGEPPSAADGNTEAELAAASARHDRDAASVFEVLHEMRTNYVLPD